MTYYRYKTGQYYCKRCEVWIFKDSKHIIPRAKDFALIHIICGNKVRMKRRKRQYVRDRYDRTLFTFKTLELIKDIKVNIPKLEEAIGIPVIGTPRR